MEVEKRKDRTKEVWNIEIWNDKGKMIGLITIKPKGDSYKLAEWL